MNRAETRLFVLAGITIFGLSVALAESRETVRLQQKALKRQDAAIELMGRSIPHLIKQIPDEVKMPTKLMEDLSAFSILSDNDII